MYKFFHFVTMLSTQIFHRRLPVTNLRWKICEAHKVGSPLPIGFSPYTSGDD